jgi:hypothetical protein
MLKFNRHSLIFGLYLLVLVAIAQYIGDYFELPLWPAYMCLIFFFVDQMDAKKAAHIIVGGIAGIAGILLFPPVIGFLAPYIGVEASKIGLILALVYAIVAFNASLPIVFNNYSFMFLTVSGLALRAPGARPFVWMAVTGLGGGLLIGGVIGIGRIVGPPPTPPLVLERGQIGSQPSQTGDYTH